MPDSISETDATNVSSFETRSKWKNLVCRNFQQFLKAFTATPKKIEIPDQTFLTNNFFSSFQEADKKQTKKSVSPYFSVHLRIRNFEISTLFLTTKYLLFSIFHTTAKENCTESEKFLLRINLETLAAKKYNDNTVWNEVGWLKIQSSRWNPCSIIDRC